MQEIIGLIADIASLVSFPVSLYAAVRIQQISRRLLFSVRSGQILEEIEKNSSDLMSSLRDIHNSKGQAVISIRKIDGLVGRVKAFVPQDVKKCITKIQKLTNELNVSTGVNSSSEDLMWSIYTEVQVFISLVRNTLEDRRVGGFDVN